MSQFVELRAFRGSRRSSVYRSHVLPRDALERITLAARDGGLATLGGLDPARQHELGKLESRRVAEEASQLRAAAVLLDLDAELTEITQIANWCARAGERSWLRLQRQT